MYHLQLDPDTGVLHSEVSGLWTVKVAEQYSAEVLPLAEAGRRQAGRFLLLIDARERKVHSQDVLDVLTILTGKLIQTPKDKMALVMTSSLTTMQVQRTAYLKQQMKTFSSVPDARQWLLS